jgi:hypothetical protein
MIAISRFLTHINNLTGRILGSKINLGQFDHNTGMITLSGFHCTIIFVKKVLNRNSFRNKLQTEQDLLGQVSRLRKREGQKYVNFYGKS